MQHLILSRSNGIRNNVSSFAGIVYVIYMLNTAKYIDATG